MNKCATPPQAAASSDLKNNLETTTPQAASLLIQTKPPPPMAAVVSLSNKKSSLSRKRATIQRSIVDVEEEIQLTPTLSFGLGPTKKDFFKQKPMMMVNLRKTDTNKIWYTEKELLPPDWKYLHFPLEMRESREYNEEEQYEDSYILSVAEKIAKETTMPIFIHAYDAQRFACVIAMLVWHLQFQIQDPIKKLHTQILNNETELTQDFPQYKQQIELTNRIITSRKKTIKKFFEKNTNNNNNNNKKQKL